MSFIDFERGNPTIPFIQRHREQQTQPERDLLADFKESERRLTILRSFTGANHEPTEEEMRRWICATRKK